MNALGTYRAVAISATCGFLGCVAGPGREADRQRWSREFALSGAPLPICQRLSRREVAILTPAQAESVARIWNDVRAAAGRLAPIRDVDLRLVAASSAGAELDPPILCHLNGQTWIALSRDLVDLVLGRWGSESLMAFILSHELAHRLLHLERQDEDADPLSLELEADQTAAFLTVSAGYSARWLAERDWIYQLLEQWHRVPEAHRRQRRDALHRALLAIEEVETLHLLAKHAFFAGEAEVALDLLDRAHRLAEPSASVVLPEKLLEELKLARASVAMSLAAPLAPWMEWVEARDLPRLCRPIFPSHTALWERPGSRRSFDRSPLQLLFQARSDLKRVGESAENLLLVHSLWSCLHLYFGNIDGAREHSERASELAGDAPDSVREALAANAELINAYPALDFAEDPDEFASYDCEQLTARLPAHHGFDAGTGCPTDLRSERMQARLPFAGERGIISCVDGESVADRRVDIVDFIDPPLYFYSAKLDAAAGVLARGCDSASKRCGKFRLIGSSDRGERVYSGRCSIGVKLDVLIYQPPSSNALEISAVIGGVK